MPIYETLTILHPDLAEARVKEVLTWMQQLVENGQGKVLQVEEWGMRDLAYRIQKTTQRLLCPPRIRGHTRGAPRAGT